jgi:hypothetical protein
MENRHESSQLVWSGRLCSIDQRERVSRAASVSSQVEVCITAAYVQEAAEVDAITACPVFFSILAHSDATLFSTRLVSGVLVKSFPLRTASVTAMPSPRKRAASSPLSAVGSGAEDDDADFKPEVTANKTPAKKSPVKSARSSTRKVKKEESDSENDHVKDEAPVTPAKRGGSKRSTANSSKKAKLEDDLTDGEGEEKPKPTPTPSKSTLAKKLKQLEAYLQTPFPDFDAPTPEQCQEVQDALARVHGLPKRPEKLVDKAGSAAGCGATPDVLDALIRTILSQNTTSKSGFECPFC